MSNVSRMATNEYIGAKRRAFDIASREKRQRILGEVCEAMKNSLAIMPRFRELCGAAILYAGSAMSRGHRGP